MNHWNQKEFQDQIWKNFKSHFCGDQKASRQTGTLTIQEPLNHTEIVNLFQKGVQKALTTIQQPMTDIQGSMQPTCMSALEEVSTPTSATYLNSVTSDLTIQSIQQQMQMIQ